MKFKKECCHCHKIFEAEANKAKYCSWLCKKVEFTKKQFSDGSNYVECKICGLRGRQLIQHITKVHNMTLDEYCKKFNLTYADLQSKDLHDQMSSHIKKACSEGRCGFQKGGYNPSQSDECKSGRNSIWSMNFKGYDGLTDEEKTKLIEEHGKKAQQSRDDNHNNATRLDYYTSRGYSEEEAEKKLAERQSTFNLEKCIEKYGEEKGREVFEARQEKWQNTLNSKPAEEIERINKKKARSVINIVAYSKISQQLFSEIYKNICNKYTNIYYATHKNNNENINKNYEYEILFEDGIHRYFLDFYVKDNNKVIEFDGDYWHGEKRGNQERDRKREEELRKLGYTNILHVKERDYKADPEKVIRECIEFIEA